MASAGPGRPVIDRNRSQKGGDTEDTNAVPALTDRIATWLANLAEPGRPGGSGDENDANDANDTGGGR